MSKFFALAPTLVNYWFTKAFLHLSSNALPMCRATQFLSTIPPIIPVFHVCFCPFVYIVLLCTILSQGCRHTKIPFNYRFPTCSTKTLSRHILISRNLISLCVMRSRDRIVIQIRKHGNRPINTKNHLIVITRETYLILLSCQRREVYN